MTLGQVGVHCGSRYSPKSGVDWPLVRCSQPEARTRVPSGKVTVSSVCEQTTHLFCLEDVMKLLFFDDFRLGILQGNSTVVDVSDVVKDIPYLQPQDVMRGLIERFADYRGRLEQAAASSQGKPLDQVRVRPPLPKPSNIICMAVNYMEDGTRAEPAPINAFQKSPLSIIGHGDTMVLQDVAATIFEGEASWRW